MPVVDAARRGRRRSPAGPAGPARAHAAAVDHGQPPRPPVHQRGGQLQRPGRRVPRVRPGRRSTTVNQPCWLVFDQGFVDRYGGFGTAAGRPGARLGARAPTPRRAGRARSASRPTRWPPTVDALERGSSRAGPRRRLRSRRQRLRRLVRRPDASTRARRRRSARWTPRPFYAVRAASARTLGTKGGPRTDVDGAVLDVDGRLIRGLFAAGNAMAAPDRHGLRRRRRHARPGAGLRLPRRPRRRPPHPLKVPFSRFRHLFFGAEIGEMAPGRLQMSVIFRPAWAL